MSRLFLVFLFLCFSSTLLHAQEWQEISSEDAATHLLKKVEPVYPAFAKTAGIEGLVSIRVGINTSGRIGSIEMRGGPPSLFKSAEEAVLRYEYRPFEADGHAVNVQTIVTVVFKLKDSKSAPAVPPTLAVALGSFGWVGERRTNVQLSPVLRGWIAERLRELLAYFSCEDATALEAVKSLDHKKRELPDSLIVVEIPTANPTTHLFVVSTRQGCFCGATGNCPMYLVEETGSDIRLAAETIGWGFHAYRRQDAVYPDVFFASHLSAAQANVVGYSNVGGLWGQLYCGEIDTNNSSLSGSHIEVCH